MSDSNKQPIPELASKVHAVFMDCLFNDDELVDGKPVLEPVRAPCIINNFGFHPERLEKHREEIKSFLRQMQEPFFSIDGGGWSFLHFCQTRHGVIWAEHPTCEELIALGIGSGMVQFCLPRESWKSMPGGVPYLVIKSEVVI